ncbi:MAG TPA: hypothetical protein VLK65_21855 [Vicinamibacteria bacterium]|nr:hypothetical protein [Vicinamibacteria bacterium]
MRQPIAMLWLFLAAACIRPDADSESDGSGAADPEAPLSAASAPAASPTPAGFEAEKLAGGPVRVVWTRDVGDGTDIISSGERLVLMGLDSRDDLAERLILSEPSSYAKPLITPRGDRVVFSKTSENSVHIVDWDGTGERRLASGFLLTVWKDPRSGREWAYVGSEQAGRNPPAYRVITRHLLDEPAVAERVWNGEPVSGNTFQLSRDGRFAGGLFPWPKAGVADLEAGTWNKLGEGCWTGFSQDDSHLLWIFDGSHRNLTLVDAGGERRWRVTINSAPGIDGFEVYHPKWANRPRFLVVTGPYTVGAGENKIRGGGSQVEIYLGRFAPDFTAVEKWARITYNDSADFYPDAWIDPSGAAVAADAQVIGPSATDAPPVADGEKHPRRLVVDVEALRDVRLPTPTEIAPYRQGLLAMEYSVLDVIEGRYDAAKVLAAHWVIRDERVLDEAKRSKGDRFRLTLEPYDDHPELEGQRLVMETDDFLLPLYYDTGS